MDSLTIGGLLESATRYLRRNRATSPHLDAELLLAQILGMDRAQLRGESEREVGSCAADAYSGLIARRGGHEPVAYILGRAYFRRLCLKVTPAVLIPRPETEELVEVALELLRRKPPWGGLAAPVASLADVGTGSGAIALSLAQETGLRVLATDTSAAALKVAATNAAATGLQGLVEFRQADLLSGVADRSLHLVISNPPYVRSEEMLTLSADVRLFEPASALDGGPDGLAIYRRLLPEAARTLHPGGTLLVEVGYDQAQAVEGMAREAGFALVRVHQDLSRKDRIVEAVLPGALVLGAEDLTGSTIEAMGRALGEGAIVGLPTDTVYGIAARWDSPAGVEALFAAKGRPPAQPVAVLFASVDAVRRALPDLSARSLAVFEALLPGPYTFIVATAVPRPKMVGSSDSLGVRVPAHPELLRLLHALDLPLAATSANLSGKADASTLQDVDSLVLAHCSAALAVGAALASGAEAGGGSADLRSLASAVVDLRPLDAGGMPVVLREGAVPSSEVLERIHHLR